MYFIAQPCSILTNLIRLTALQSAPKFLFLTYHLLLTRCYKNCTATVRSYTSALSEILHRKYCSAPRRSPCIHTDENLAKPIICCYETLMVKPVLSVVNEPIIIHEQPNPMTPKMCKLIMPIFVLIPDERYMIYEIHVQIIGTLKPQLA